VVREPGKRLGKKQALGKIQGTMMHWIFPKAGKLPINPRGRRSEGRAAGAAHVVTPLPRE
jgi:hypothetical protein